MRRRAWGLVALVAWIVAVPAAAQCTIGGAVTVERVVVGGVTVSPAALPRVEVAWPQAEPVAAQLRAPFDAPATLTGVPLRLAADATLPAAFFDVPEGGARTASIGVAPDGRTIRFGGLTVRGVDVACDDVRLGAENDPPVARAGVAYRADALMLRARPSRGARGIEVTGPGTVESSFEVIERRGAWARLRMVLTSGLVLRGWTLFDEEHTTRFSGAPGYSSSVLRIPSVPSGPDAFAGCYVGPSFFEADTPIYSDDASTVPWGAVVDGAGMMVRDCGGGRAEIVRAMGTWVSFGWVEGASLTRLGATRCGSDFVLHQDRRTLRVGVLESSVDAVRAGDEVVRFGRTRIVGTPFDTVRPVWPSAVCDAWEDHEPVTLRRGGDEVVVSR